METVSSYQVWGANWAKVRLKKTWVWFHEAGSVRCWAKDWANQTISSSKKEKQENKQEASSVHFYPNVNSHFQTNLS